MHSWSHTWRLSHQPRTPISMKFTSLLGKLHFYFAGHHRNFALITNNLLHPARSVRGPQPFPVYLNFYFLHIMANAAWATSFPTEIQINFTKIFLKAYTVMRSRWYCTRLMLKRFFTSATSKHTLTLTVIVATRKTTNSAVPGAK